MISPLHISVFFYYFGCVLVNSGWPTSIGKRTTVWKPMLRAIQITEQIKSWRSNSESSRCNVTCCSNLFERDRRHICFFILHDAPGSKLPNVTSCTSDSDIPKLWLFLREWLNESHWFKRTELLNVGSLRFGLIRRRYSYYSKPEKVLDEYFVTVLRVGTFMVHLLNNNSDVNTFQNIKKSSKKYISYSRFLPHLNVILWRLSCCWMWRRAACHKFTCHSEERAVSIFSLAGPSHKYVSIFVHTHQNMLTIRL